MKKILLIIVIFFLGVYFLLTKFFPNVEINRYDSLETVKTQGGIKRGWIPKNLPASAYDIAETHELDSSTVVGKFSYREEDEKSFLAGLAKGSDGVYEADGFLFKVDSSNNLVNFRNVPNE